MSDDIQERLSAIRDQAEAHLKESKVKRKERLKDLILVQANLHWVAGFFEGYDDGGTSMVSPASFLDTPLEIIDEMIREEIENA